ncbi:hypothetical protein PR202_gb27897 [Eleusine coracana subsp. coracana]|uniref:Secreted protein n=1 Tax=Eleusine coracana subsp. coracana TaxID=191504 RepID=A0AAV5FXB0_ELECO|nr:hypothetical protein PR202_gb27897 [Eleusine coracana subsp. coracana]
MTVAFLDSFLDSLAVIAARCPLSLLVARSAALAARSRHSSPVLVGSPTLIAQFAARSATRRPFSPLSARPRRSPPVLAGSR